MEIIQTTYIGVLKSMLISHSLKFLSRCLSLSSKWNDTIESTRNFSAILTLVHLSQNIINCSSDRMTIKRSLQVR